MLLKVRWEDFGNPAAFRLREDYLFNIQAKRLRVEINDYTSADTFEAEIDYKNFPFDPRCIRSCGVTIAMQDVGKIFQQTNELNPIQISRENTVFIGFADDESISFNDTTRTVKLSGRDFTSLMIDRKFLKGTLNLELPLDQVVQTLLNELDETKPLAIDKRVPGDLPILSSFYSDKSELSGKKNTRKDESYWDVIQDVVRRAGLIAYVELDKLVISKPRVLFDKSAAKKFVYGKNLKSLEFKRKLGRRKNFNIVVRSMSVETKEVLEARIPSEATEAWAKETGISNIEIKIPELDAEGVAKPEADLKAAPYIAFLIPDVVNKDHLIEVGQQIYEEIGRQEIEGTFETDEMRTSWNTTNDGQSVPQEFNILNLRNGTPVQVEIDQGDLKGINKFNKPKDRERFLLQRGYSQKAAAALAETLSNPRMNGPMYARSVSYTLDQESGFSCSVSFINFIETSNPVFGGG